MKKSLIASTMTLGICSLLSAQVGINIGENVTPKVTLQIDGKPDETTVQDGILIPRLTITQLTGKDNAYSADQNGTLVFITDVTGTTSIKTSDITSKGLHYYDSTAAKWVPVTTKTEKTTPNVRVIESAGDYTATIDDDIIVVSTTNGTGGLVNIDLPKTGFPIGKRIVVSVIGYKNNAPSVFFRMQGETRSGVRDYEGKGVIYSGLTREVVYIGRQEPNPNTDSIEGATLAPWVITSGY